MKTLQNLMDETSRWSDETFDRGRRDPERSVSISYHLSNEVEELRQALRRRFGHVPTSGSERFLIHVLEELADCQILLADITARLDISENRLIATCFDKLEVNRKRSWGEPDENGVVRHLTGEFNPQSCITSESLPIDYFRCDKVQ